MIIVHTCGSCNFVISDRRGSPLPLGTLERLRHFIVALPGPSKYVISIHLAPGIVLGFKRIDTFLRGCTFQTCLIVS